MHSLKDAEAKDRLYSWGRIAKFLNVSPRTAQMWEKERGLPVHRAHQGRRGTVFAYLEDLNAWLEAEGDLAELEGYESEAQPLIRRFVPRNWLLLVGIVILVNIVCLALYHLFLK